MANTVTLRIKIDTKDGVKTVGDLNEEFSQTLETMDAMEKASADLTEALKNTKVGTAEYKALSAELIKVNTELKNQELALEALDREQVASELKSVAGGFADIAGGMALVGAGSQKLEELVQTIAQVEGATKIFTGAMEAGASAMKLKNTIIAKATAAQEMLAAATLKGGVVSKVAAVAMRILNAVMAANPVFLIIMGITALVGALAWFITSTNDAAEAAEKLNAEMEAQNKLIQVQRNLRKTNAEIVSNEIANQKKVLEGEKKLLESKKNLTQADKDRIKSINEEIKALEGQEFEAVKKEAVKQATENTNAILNQFELIKKGINATDYEDGVNDIDYSAAQSKLANLKTSFAAISAELSKTGDFEKYQESLSNLTNRAGVLSKEFSLLNLELGSAESEVWVERVTGEADELVQMFADANTNAADLVKALNNKETANTIANQNDLLEEQKKKEDAIKAAADAARKAEEKRKQVLQDINDILQRERNAAKEIAKTKIELIQDETIKTEELINKAYGDERDRLIEGAIKREEAKLQEKFVKGKIKEQEYRDEVAKLYENGADYLLDIEVQLLEEKDKIRKQELNNLRKDVQQRIAQEIATLENVDVVNQEIAQMKLDSEKETRMHIARMTIDDERALEEELLKINKEFLDKEVAQINASLEEQKQARKAQYEADIKDKDLTDEQKALMQAEYNRDIVALETGAQSDIQALYEETNDKVAEGITARIAKFMEEWGTVVQFAFDSVSQAMDIISQAMDEVAARAESRRETEYAAQEESLNQMLANRTITEEQFNQRKEELDQNMAAKELAAKKKAFKQQKAMAIVNAVMQTAQAVLAAFTSAASVPLAGVMLGPIMAGVAGALGAAQIAVISSQQFRAAKGGVVPGAPSMTDSVNSLLAPGEMVINSNSAQMFPDLLSTINQAGGGIALTPDIPTKATNDSNRPVYGDNMVQQPIKAYVVENEMTEKQKKINRIERSAEF